MQRNDRLDSTSSESFRVNDQYVHVEASQQPAHPDWLYLDAWERRQAQTTFVDSGGYSGRWLNGKFEFYSGQFDLQQHPGAAAAKDNGRGTVFSDALRRCAVQSIGRIQEGISPLRGGEHVDDHQWRGYSEKPSDHNQDLYARFDSRESEQYYERWYQGGYSGELSSSQASPGFLATSVTARLNCYPASLRRLRHSDSRRSSSGRFHFDAIPAMHANPCCSLNSRIGIGGTRCGRWD
jgi:hypothetical protein